MPCPPDPFDLELSRQGNEYEKQKARFEALYAESRHTVDACRKLLALEPRDEHAPALAAALEALNRRSPTPQGGPPDPSLAAGHDSLGGALNAMAGPVDALAADVKKLETELCIARDALLRLARATGHERHAEVEREQMLHLAHRRADRELALASARSLANLAESQLARKRRGKKLTFDQPLEELERASAEAKAEVERIAALTDEDLLDSREL